jgi:hypothetical protein
MNIRPAVLADIPAIVELAVESVSQDPIPVRIDREGMADTARELIAGNSHFSWVAEVDGKIVGAVGASTGPGFWFERSQSSVLMFYSKSPGAGIALLRQYAKWVKSRPAIKMAVFSLERAADPRIGRLLQRLGFGMMNPQYTYVRGME